ncbi:MULTISPECIES: hypothetical protein [unclassified Haloarcula]|uniref:hypothetical protein n=1 Tax=unclassified Haloarcula TaxID=2624677 RepID=UPI0012AB3D63|nr:MULTISPECIES: hypothetical protein [unclassified Haloarcula]
MDKKETAICIHIVGVAAIVLGLIAHGLVDQTRLGLVLIGGGTVYAVVGGVAGLTLIQDQFPTSLAVATIVCIEVIVLALPIILIELKGSVSHWFQSILQGDLRRPVTAFPWEIASVSGVVAFILGSARQRALQWLAVLFIGLASLHLVQSSIFILQSDSIVAWTHFAAIYIVVAVTLILSLPLYHLGRQVRSTQPSSSLPAYTAGVFVCGLLGLSMIIAVAVHPANLLSWTIATVVAIALFPILLYFAYYEGLLSLSRGNLG